jgi:hypothetical protein
MTSHRTCSTGPYWNTEMCDRTVDKYSEAKKPSSWTTGGSCSIFPQLSVLEDLLRPSYLSLQITECHTYPALHHRPDPSCTQHRLTDGRRFYSRNFTKICADDCFNQTMQPEIQDVASSELWTVTVRLNICLQRSSSNESLVMPVTNLYCRRNWRLMYGVGIR